MTAKLAFGIMSIIPAVLAYFFYFRDMFAGKTKPHTFSWLIWGTLAANGFFAQIGAHAGFGAWVTGLTAAASLAIFCFALHKGDTELTRFDWLLLVLALLGFVLLFVVKDRDVALGITLFALSAGFAMTLHKVYRHPRQEAAKAFVLNTIKFVPGILALGSFSFLTVAYPFVALVGKAAIAWLIIVRRKQLAPGVGRDCAALDEPNVR
jgi:hypothetical protein